ncbi:MAG: hypothetical protein UT61_C0011G0004 [Candidatus Woesebacteria bacterium GW2011_GWA1_39_8]|uniref:Uncharacterized protein n=1 Tax=Candidatus Woesebacteria bacterium GW2011_GWA1_39_8 TaxID=1618552 RepID=A0A0G0PYM5_9BACT|nr:MAG: hypothetical protein UT61_C0011G0004 [Candidatus Woesebacteria bacterium GW2011_GWA1_39_8]
MGNKQIIILIVVIFIAFVGYKAISSNIQENKEKAVLQEKYQLQELAKEPLNQCLENIDNETEKEIKEYKDLIRDVRTPSSQESCLKLTGHGSNIDALIAAGKINLKDYCWPSYEDEEAEIQKIISEAKTEKEECYKQYK